jgi:hypothetical protein
MINSTDIHANGAGSAADTAAAPAAAATPRRWFRRAPWERLCMILIGLGIVMLMQPFWMLAYTWSFPVILAGTVGFMICSHFRE